MAYSAHVKAKYFRLREEGYSQLRASKELGINKNTAVSWEKTNAASIGGSNYRALRAERQLAMPKEADSLAITPAKCLEDFGAWRERYLGRRSTPWQEEAAYNVVAWLRAPATELVVVNAPPGSGKSTLFTHDIPLWMICRERSIRILIGSRTFKLASQYALRMRRALERVAPLPANPSQGRLFPAKGCLAQDYGRFKPEIGDIWRQDQFSVLTPGDDQSSLEDKEPTVASYGMDSEFLGARANLVIWDDLVVGRTLRNIEQVENQRKWWSEEGETRVEPGGCLILQGQRMGADDLYRYALDQRLGYDEDGDEVEESKESRYRHVLYPAHFEDVCEKKHTREAPAYPQGCLLDPIRLPWTGANGLLTIRQNRNDKYRVQYQQEDVDPDTVLVPKIWIDGGRDSDGIEYPGCWDNYRGLCELPRGLSQPWYSVATADPSPTNYWAIEWWVYHPASEQRFLMDLHREKMEAPEFLDWNENSKSFYGLMHDWQERSTAMNARISHWIIEQNAAQRFILQYEHIKRWQRLMGTNIIAHNTTRNKLDPEYGIQTIRDRYRFGNVRLPGKNDTTGTARLASLKLVNEATRYPNSTTDDCLMAQWFFEFNLPSISKPIQARQPRLPRPRFMLAGSNA